MWSLDVTSGSTSTGPTDGVRRQKNRREQRAGVLALAFSLGLSAQVTVAPPANAQQDPVGDRDDVAAGEDEAAVTASDDGAPVRLAPVTVNARLITEDARDVPFAVTVIDGEDAEQRGYVSTEELLRETPGVAINTSGGANVSSIYIRGVGALYPMNMDDAFVAVNLDGSPLTTRHLSLASLDVERIEVLKGPQGTLFGGLGGAGAINIISRRPTRDFEGYLRGEIGEEGQRLLAAAAGGPLSEQFSARLAIQHTAYDYPIINLQTGEPVSEPDMLGIRGSLLWDLSPQTSALLIFEYDESRHMGENIVLLPFGDQPLMDVTAGIYDYSHKVMYRSSLQIEHQFEDFQLTSISAYADVDNLSPVIFDRLLFREFFGFTGEFWRDQEAHERVFTQDLRLSSLPEADLSWVAGLSALYSQRTFNHPRQGNLGGVIPGFSQYRDFTTQRYGVYGEVTVPLLEDLRGTVGLRHTVDLKTYDATYTNGGISVSDSDELDDNFTTGRVGLTYALTPEANLYATFARGYNPGGFQDYAESVGDAAYQAGTILSGETGVKAEFFDRRLRLEGSFFYTDVQDNYLIDSDGVNSFILNADTRSVGTEWAASWLVDESLTLSGGLSYINATIRDSVLTSQGGPVTAGNAVPDVPEWSGRLTALFNHDLPDIGFLSSPQLNARLDYTYVGARPADVQNNFDLDPYHEIDIRLGIAASGAELYFWGRNLLDEHNDLYGFYDAASDTRYGAPTRGRTFGVGFAMTF